MFDGPAPAPRLVGLWAHAAVRLAAPSAGGFDRDDFPAHAAPPKSSSKFSLGRSLRSVTAYLSAKPRAAFRERRICVEGAAEAAAFFVVRDVSRDGGADEAIARFPLSGLVDVTGYAVFEKEAFEFKHAPEPSLPAETGMSTSFHSCPSLYSSQNDVGLQLVFRDMGASASSPKVHYHKVELRFASSDERGIWLCAMEHAYTELLLDSIRTGEDARFSSADTRRLVEESTRLMESRPPPAVLERHVDFFLSSAGQEETEQSDAPAAVDLSDVPGGGVLRIGIGDGEYITRRFAHKASAKRTASGALVERGYLVMRPTTLSQHVRMVPKLKVPAFQLRVVVEEEHWGNGFFLEQTREASAGGESLLRVSQKQSFRSRNNSITARSDSSNGNSNRKSKSDKKNDGGDNFEITEIIELQAESFPHRLKWLNWFEALLGKPTVYLSRNRESKEANGRNHTPLQRFTSLFPKSNISGDPKCAGKEKEVDKKGE